MEDRKRIERPLPPTQRAAKKAAEELAGELNGRFSPSAEILTIALLERAFYRGCEYVRVEEIFKKESKMNLKNWLDEEIRMKVKTAFEIVLALVVLAVALFFVAIPSDAAEIPRTEEAIEADICDAAVRISNAQAAIDSEKAIEKVSGIIDKEARYRAGKTIVLRREELKGYLAEFKKVAGKEFPAERFVTVCGLEE